jgi:PAP2 superfamily
MWLSWNISAVCAVLLCGGGILLRHRLRLLAAAARETAMVFALYTMWRLFNRVDLHMDGAMERGRQIWRWQRFVGIGSERWLQEQVLDSGPVVQFMNGYYALVHVPSMVVFLLWLFFRRRSEYRPWRALLALSTGADVLIRLVPVAPPRLMPELGFVDTAILYDQSVYGRFGAGVSDQLAAMPSIHVGWAALIAWAMWRLGGTSGRVIGISHLVLTCLAVVVTANHWWLDGIVAAALLPPIAWIWSRGQRLIGTATFVADTCSLSCSESY